MTTRNFVAGAAGGALAALALNTAKARAAGAPSGIDPQLWELLLSNQEILIAQQGSLNELIQGISNLTLQLGGSPVIGEDPFANQDLFTTGQLICTVLNQGFQLPPIPIPKNKQLIVKALPSNVGWIWLARQPLQARTITVAYPLLPNEGVGLFINNADRVWVAVEPVFGVLNDGVAFIVEQE